MKIPYFLILTVYASATNVYADTQKLLPPVLDNSTYSNAVPSSSPSSATAATSQLTPPRYEETVKPQDNSLSFDKLKADIVELKNKVQEQEDAINTLKRANAEWQKKASDLNKNSTTSLKAPMLDTNTSSSITTKTTTSLDTEKDRYKHASDLLKKGDYSQAQQEFEALIKAYPTGSYADNAQYWIGVALLNKGDKKAAMQAFDHLARAYPKSDKIPDALFKLGDVLISLKNKAKAKEYFDYVIQNYPGTNGAKLAIEKKQQEKL